MRTNLIVGLFLMVALHMSAQLCDIATTGVKTSASAITIGETTELSFSVYNDAKGSKDYYTANSVRVILALPENGLSYQSLVTPAAGAFFNWTYEPSEHTLVGINHTAIRDGQSETVKIKVLATPVNMYPTTRTVVLNIQQNPDSRDIFPSNNATNDNSTAAVTLSAPVPMQLVSFSALSTKCTSVDVSWTTVAEKFSDYMEVQRSIDGKEFTTIGKVKGSNKSVKTSYNFKDEKGLVTGTKYFYRLNQVDLGGNTQVLDIISLDHNCPAGALNMALYPNPAFDKVNVSLAGFNNTETVKLVVTNAVGELMMTIPGVVTKNITEIKLNGLNAGVYSVKVVGYENQVTKRFIKID